MSNTIRWYQKPEKVKRLSKTRSAWRHPWKYTNPYYFRHELKLLRIKQHREYRHLNRIRVKKGMDILIEPKTNGWLTH